jgi:uncharacterized protein
VAKAVTDASKEAVLAAAPQTNAKLKVNGLPLEAVSEGEWGNNLRARIEHISTDTTKFNLLVHDSATKQTEVFLNVTIADGPRNVKQVLESESSLVSVSGALSGTEIPAAHPAPELGKTIWTDDTLSTKVDIPASNSKSLGPLNYQGNEKTKKGIYALEDTDLFNILCIPPDARDQDLSQGVYQTALSYCVKRRAFLLVDPPLSWKQQDTLISEAAQKVTELNLNGTDARNAAVFYPRVLQSDPLKDGHVSSAVPSGIIAGLMARTDAQRGVWKAPAGIDAGLNGINGLEVTLTDGQNGTLNQVGINCLRNFPIYGRVAWGSRTLRGADQAADEYKYIPVRRTALFIEESLFRGLKWVVFEPNDEPLWAQIRLNVGAFMNNLFRQGAFQGRSPREAYFVKCDNESTTQNDINLGIVNVLVGFAPLKPAEFVIVKLQQIAGQIEV